MQPASQKDRPISFLVFDRDTFVDGRDLVIRPEELSRHEPMRTSVLQTLGGAWADDFGAGVASLTLAGHTGWRGGRTEDGVAQFLGLRDLIVERWTALRAAKAKSGGNQDDIRLVLADQLDRFTLFVAPTTFQLRRHKSRPLLMQYNISLAVLGSMDYADVATSQDYVVEAIHNPTRHELAVKALLEVQRKQAEAGAELAASGLGAEMVSTAQGILDSTGRMLDTVRTAAVQAKGVIDDTLRPLFQTSVLILEASRNAFQILTAAGGVAEYGKAVLQRIAGNFQDAACTLKLGFDGLLTIPDWSDLFGASACSSTGGGRPHSPWATENPFYRVIPAADGQSVRMIPAAVTAVRELRHDTLANVFPPAEILSRLRTVSTGMTWA